MKDQTMKKIAIIAIALSAVSAVPASAQTLTYNLNAQVAPVCGVYSSAGTSIDVDFGALASVASDASVNVPAGSATYRCNSTNGFTRTITSQNNGFMTLDGNATTDNTRRIAFTMTHGGGSSLGFAAQQLSTALSNSFPASNAFLNGQTGGVSFQAFGVQSEAGGNGSPGTTVYAGNYQDTVTITVTAN
jgi:spore coat protein U-like protein